MTDLSKKMAQLAFDALEDKKAEDIKVLNIGEITVLAIILSLPEVPTAIRYRQWLTM